MIKGGGKGREAYLRTALQRVEDGLAEAHGSIAVQEVD